MRREQTQSKHLKQPEPKHAKPKRVKEPEEKPVIERIAEERAAARTVVQEQKPQVVEAPAEETVEKKEKVKKEKQPRKKVSKKVKGILIAVLVVCVLIVGAGIGAVIFGMNLEKSGVIFPNVYVGSIPVGNLTAEQAEAKLNEEGWEESVSATLVAHLPTDIVMEVDYLTAGARRTSAQNAQLAVEYGKNGAVGTFLAYVENLITPVNVDEEPFTIDRDYIAGLVEEAQVEFAANTKGKGYAVDMEKKTIAMLKSADGTGMVSEDIIAAVTAALFGSLTEITYELPKTDEIVMPDFDALHEEIFAEVADAGYDAENRCVTDEVVGVDFSIEEAKKLWTDAEVGTEIIIPLTVTEPEITREEYEALLFRDLLGAYSSSLSGSTDNRINNVTLASGKIDGYILAPGEIFSYNDTVGQRTKASGFLEAAAYSSGKVVQEVGGGICQVSSTLYCAELLAQLTTVDRTCHMFAVSYLPPAFDATVSWPGPDFQFQNTRDYPVKIVSYVDSEENTVTVEIWGTDIDGSYVELKYSNWTVYDEEYPDVAVGSGAKLYREFYDKDGNFITSETENRSTYDYHPEDIKWPEDKDKDEPGGDTPGGDTPGGDTPGGEGGDTPGGEGGGEGTGGETPGGEQPQGE